MDGKSEIYFIGVVEERRDNEARIRIFPKYCAGLKGVKGFSHLIVLYWMHLRDDEIERRTLLVFPRKHTVNLETGVFACRSPSRPNPIGLCTVKLLEVEGCALTVRGLDAFNNSPIIDIKPYIPRVDSVPNAKVPEWLLNNSQRK